MERKTHLPALLGEPIQERQERCRQLLDILLLAEAFLDLAILAGDSSRDAARLLLDAPGPLPVLLVGPGYGDEILAVAGAAGAVTLENLTNDSKGSCCSLG